MIDARTKRERVRALVTWMMTELEEKYRADWDRERFSAPAAVVPPFGEVPFDAVFLWKCLAIQRFALNSGPVFASLATSCGGGPEMVRELDTIPDAEVGSLREAFRDGRLPARVQRGLDAASTHRGITGWKWFACGVQACKKLVRDFGPSQRDSYVACWLSQHLGGRDWDGTWPGLIRACETALGPVLSERLLERRVTESRELVIRRLVRPANAHLAGVGPETIHFFFRDWLDVPVWKFGWKHDDKNRDFWREASLRLELGIDGDDPVAVIRTLTTHLTPAELNDGWLAAINTTAYRLLFDCGRGGLPGLRQVFAELRAVTADPAGAVERDRPQ